MTSKEEKTIEKLIQLVKDVKNENKLLTERLDKTVKEIDTKVNEKHVPIYLEKDILSTVQISIQQAIQNSLTGYGSPLTKLVTEVINEHSIELKEIISKSFDETIKKDEFKKSIVDAFSHKIARTIISNNDSLFDKVSNQLKQDAIFKSKMALAVANVVNECLENK